MARYQVILAYDGTEFHGFQRQAEARTVQSVVETALKQLGWQGRAVLAAGRTDTGVHASGQVIAFDLDWKHNQQDLQSALNASLPSDVAARKVEAARSDFHPRYDAVARRYRYQVLCLEWREPLRERYTWRVWPPVEPELLHQAAQSLLGRHDFAAFGTPPRPGGSTVRSVFRAAWQPWEADPASGLAFEIVAESFLYRMVRRLVFAQVAEGQGRLPTGTIRESLSGRLSAPSQGLAPPQGLVLAEVVYPNASEAGEGGPEVKASVMSGSIPGRDSRKEYC